MNQTVNPYTSTAAGLRPEHQIAIGPALTFEDIFERWEWERRFEQGEAPRRGSVAAVRKVWGYIRDDVFGL